MSYIRTLGAFLYAAIISLVYLWLSALIVTISIICVSGFWYTLFTAIGFAWLFGWISERGVELLSIPFNWLWDRTKKTRIATIVPIIIIGLWCIAMPIRIHLTLKFGDWVLIGIWEIISLMFFYNLVMLPFINTNIGVGCNDIHHDSMDF
jgi:hypothetical protein